MKRILTISVVLGVMVFFGASNAQAQWGGGWSSGYGYGCCNDAAQIISAAGQASAQIGSVIVANRQIGQVREISNQQIATLEAELQRLRAENAALKEQSRLLEEQNRLLAEQNRLLKKEIKRLDP